MSRGARQPWSRWALIGGILSLVGVVGAVYYGASIALAALALTLALVGRARGERSRSALLVPIAGILAGLAVYALYLQFTAPDPSAGEVIEESFTEDFDDSFNEILGDDGAGGFGEGFGGPSAAPGEDAARAEDAAQPNPAP